MGLARGVADIGASQKSFDFGTLTRSHEYCRPHVEGGRLFHGGFLANGSYAPPRTLERVPAVDAWAQAVIERGGRLLDCSVEAHPYKVSPNIEQQALLLRSGVKAPLWDMLSVTGVNEGKGETLCFVAPLDFQSLVDDDIADTATGHLWKGLFWAHGVDEAGDRETPQIGGHKQMWFAIRDELLGPYARPRPQIPTLHTRPGAGSREMPDVPAPVEKLIQTLLALLQIEVHSLSLADYFVDLFMRDDLFLDRREQAAMAIRLVERIRHDEASHIAYLRVFISELRGFSFKTPDGHKRGSEFIDPVWNGLLAWPDAAELVRRRHDERDVISRHAHEVLGPTASALMEKFDALADA